MGIVEAITAIITILAQVVPQIIKTSGTISAENKEQWFKDLAESFKLLRKAKTDEDKANVADKLSSLIKHID